MVPAVDTNLSSPQTEEDVAIDAPSFTQAVAEAPYIASVAEEVVPLLILISPPHKLGKKLFLLLVLSPSHKLVKRLLTSLLLLLVKRLLMFHLSLEKWFFLLILVITSLL